MEASDGKYALITYQRALAKLATSASETSEDAIVPLITRVCNWHGIEVVTTNDTKKEETPFTVFRGDFDAALGAAFRGDVGEALIMLARAIPESEPICRAIECALEKAKP